jgi:hypothetical protein
MAEVSIVGPEQGEVALKGPTRMRIIGQRPVHRWDDVV